MHVNLCHTIYFPDQNCLEKSVTPDDLSSSIKLQSSLESMSMPVWNSYENSLVPDNFASSSPKFQGDFFPDFVPIMGDLPSPILRSSTSVPTDSSLNSVQCELESNMR